jgi:hypothetical protein
LKKKLIALALLFINLWGCYSKDSIRTPTPWVTPTSTVTPRWMMYEAALLKATVGKEDGLCEWAILGTSANEVYVWVDCKLRGPVRTAMSVPAVVYLGENGAIEKVTIPRDGVFYPEDVRALFPPDIQVKIFSHDTGDIIDMKYLEARSNNGGPPLIVVLGTPMP